MRVLLLCDQKWRDLPNLAATKLKLRSLGHDVSIATTKEMVPLLTLFRPDCIVFNHLNGQTYRRYAQALRDAGIAIVIMPTEGLPHPVAMPLVCGEFTDFSLVDLYLSWNEEVTRGIRERGAAGPREVATVGCGRMDFYCPPLSRAVASRTALAQKLGLDPARPIVVWATQYNFADHHGIAGAQWAKFLQEATDLGAKPCLDRIGLSLAAIPADQNAARAAAAAAFEGLVRELPDVQFVIKPHPAESIGFYDRLVRTLGGRGATVRLCDGVYIWDVLNAADVLLHRHCTTAVEAWILGRPTVEMAMRREPGYEWPEREAGSFVAESVEALVEIVSSQLSEPRIDAERAALRSAYLEKWLHRIDGRRCETIAATIDGFLATRPRARRSAVGLPELRRPLAQAAAALRYALSVPAGVRTAELLRPRAASWAASGRWATRQDVARYERDLGRAMASE